jgi:MFS family permease
MAGPVGALLGGLLAGPLADAGGYAVMFSGFALLTLIWPLLVYLLKDAQPEKAASAQAVDAPRAGLGWRFWLLFAASLLVMAASMAGVMGRSLVMDALKFSAAAISSTGAVSGAVALPFGLLAGVLSDRLGRRGLLALGFLSTALGLGVMVFAAELWHFWLAISLITVQNAVSGAVGSALVTDLVPKARLSLGMALYSATAWLGGIAGFAATGLAAQALGFAPTFGIAALLALVAAGTLLAIKPARLPQS